MFLRNKAFHDPLRFFEFSDYQLPDKSQSDYQKNEKSLATLIKWSGNIEKYLMDFGGFIIIFGGMNTGKTISAHILARESYLQGYLCNLVSLADLSVDLSHSIDGTVAKDRDGNVAFDLDDYVNCDILCVDNFELINDYFDRPNIRRALIFKMLRDRLRAGKPTIVISQRELSELFSDTTRELKGIPYDFPPLISKHYKQVWLYGRFKKEIKAGSK
jgi:DNA replication protein DnaC